MNATACANMSTAAMEYAMCLEEAEQEPFYLSCPDPTLCNVTQSDGNVGLAFGLTIGAGLATTLGALLPFIPCIKRSNTQFLAIGLGLAAGVMLYVSFTEIWTKALDNFCCVTPNHYDLAVTACFFGGILLMILLELAVAGLQRVDCGCCIIPLSARERRRCGCCLHRPRDKVISLSATNTSGQLEKKEQNDLQNSTTDDNGHIPRNEDNTNTPPAPNPPTTDCVSVSTNSVTPSDNTINYGIVSVNDVFSTSSLIRMNAVIPESTEEEAAREEEEGEGEGESSGYTSQVSISMEGEQPAVVGSRQRRTSYQEMSDNLSSSYEEEALGPKEFKEVTEVLGKSTKKLHRMGILTGLAIGIHNFPEGLATFVAALSSPSLGATLAVAIALHNIPEGLCVAMPVYYATGKRWKGFLWAFFSGISEPMGALLGWLVLRNVFGPLVYGISFGFIAGMMVFISLKELLPTAYRFDRTKGQLVSGCLVVGMLVMAISLILFLY